MSTTAEAPPLPAAGAAPAAVDKKSRQPGQDIASKLAPEVVSIEGVTFREKSQVNFKKDSVYAQIVLQAIKLEAGRGIKVNVPSGVKPNKVSTALAAAIKKQGQKGKLYTRTTADGAAVFVMKSATA